MKKYALIVCVLVSVSNVFSQDIETLSPTTNWLQLNPAYAGSNGGFRTQLYNCTNGASSYYRQVQTGISSDLYLKKIKSGISISANALNISNGLMIENAYSIGYSKRIVLIEHKIEIVPALQITGIRKSVDLTAVNYGMLIDPRFDERFQLFAIGEAPNSRKNALDFSAGALVDLKNGFVIGFAARHINQPDIGLSGSLKLPARYVLHASYDKVFDEHKLLNVLVVLSEQNGTEVAKLQASAVFKKHLYIGCGGGVSNNYQIGTALLGYRGNFWTFSTVLGTNYYPESQSFWNSAELALSVNIRDKEQRKSLTSLHTW